MRLRCFSKDRCYEGQILGPYVRHGMYQNRVSDHKCGLRAICRHVNKKHQQTWVGWGLEMTITLWPLKFKCAIFGSGEGERGTFFVVFLDPITRIESAPKESVRRLNETTLQASTLEEKYSVF